MFLDFVVILSSSVIMLSTTTTQESLILSVYSHAHFFIHFNYDTHLLGTHVPLVQLSIQTH